jgi:hypothetical protein
VSNKRFLQYFVLQKSAKIVKGIVRRKSSNKSTVSVRRESDMPVHLLSAADRDRANRFPLAITYDDLVTFFTLSVEDQEQIPVHAGPHARLGFTLELCALRFMGFVPDDLTSAPPEAVTFVARQLAVEPAVSNLAIITVTPVRK